MEKKIIYTIGHSTHTLEEFVAMFQSFKVQTLVDIRSFPGSRKYPQFNLENLELEMPQHNIRYLYLKNLGGRRKVNKDSKNTRWHNASFRAYADYMGTENFKNAILELEDIASKSITTYMCAEAVWWRCHRSLVSDYLKFRGWEVFHIMGVDKAQAHTYTSPAIVTNNQLSYSDLIL